MNDILILEDDPLWGDRLRDKILGANQELSVLVLETESDFRLGWLKDFDEGKNAKPKAIVIDVMLRWTDPDPDQPARPPDVIEGGHIRAGLRCRQDIKKRTALKDVPVILYTSLTDEDLGRLGADLDGVQYISKDDGDKIVKPVLDAIARA